jgi:phosphatidate cytidylyltransferase
MNLLLRVLSGVVLLGILAAAMWAGMPWVAAVVGVAAMVGAWEFAGLARRMGLPPPAWILYPLTLWLALRFAFPAAYQTSDWPLIAALTVGLLGVVVVSRSVRGWAAALAGSLYVGFGLGFFVALYGWHTVDSSHFGLRLVALPLLAVFAGDTAAYFVGTAIGRHRFFAAISPKKTVEGAVAGAAATILVAVLVGPPLVGLGAGAAAGLGALVAVAAQGGDLVESALKREAGAKDSSGLIPGHGGLLDRLDSLVLVGPIVYCYLKLLSFT